MAAEVEIAPITAEEFEELLPLIAAYQRFYKAEPDEARNHTHFGRLLDDHDAGIQFVALDEVGQALGFATLYFPLGSVTPGVACLMNDLFVVPEARGHGIGRALILHCLSYAKAHGFPKIHWQTALDNHTAQRLYDSLPTTRSGWYTYRLEAGD